MAIKKNYVKANGKVYDVRYHLYSDLPIICASFYEVIRPHRKRFGRTKFFSFVYGRAWVEDFETIDKLLMHIFDSAVKEQEEETELNKKIKEFLKTP